MKEEPLLLRNKLTFVLLSALLSWPLAWQGAKSQQVPTNNPIAEFYGAQTGYPAWTDQINWGNVIDMSSFSEGANDFEKFENARDELYNQGGGVLYYPAGVYDFSDIPQGPNGRGLMLKKGVVIRGEKPQSGQTAIQANDTTQAGLQNLGTVFRFPFAEWKNDGHIPQEWNMIGAMPGANENGLDEVSHLGVAWVKTIGATLYFGYDATQWADTYGQAQDNDLDWKSALIVDSWRGREPDGTHPMDTWLGDGTDGKFNSGEAHGGKYRFVFGVRLEDAAVVNKIQNNGQGTIADGQFLEGSYRFAPRMGVDGSHIFVANSAIPKSDSNFIYQQATNNSNGNPKAQLFDYGDGIGLDINKSLHSLHTNRCIVNGGAYYEEDVIVRDNYIYSHGNKGYEIAGTEVVVKDNVNNRDYLREGDDNAYPGLTGWELATDGWKESRPVEDNLSRAYDLGGHNLWVDGNFYNNTGSDPGNDGEGVMAQRLNSIEVFSWAMTNNRQGSLGNGEKSWVGTWDTHAMGLLVWQNDHAGNSGLNKHKVSNTSADITVVENKGGGENLVSGEGEERDSLNECPNGAPTEPTNVTVNPMENGYKITWDHPDSDPNELGFRVDRRIKGQGDNWVTVAYRPRHESGGQFNYTGPQGGGGPFDACEGQEMDFNKQEWTDYLAAPNTEYEYRVVAMTCESLGFPNGGATSDPQAADTLITALQETEQSLGGAFSLQPVPNDGSFELSMDNDHSGNVQIRIFDLNGRQVWNRNFGKTGKTARYQLNTELDAGVYILRATMQDQVAVKKLVVE